MAIKVTDSQAAGMAKARQAMADALEDAVDKVGVDQALVALGPALENAASALILAADEGRHMTPEGNARRQLTSKALGSISAVMSLPTGPLLPAARLEEISKVLAGLDAAMKGGPAAPIDGVPRYVDDKDTAVFRDIRTAIALKEAVAKLDEPFRGMVRWPLDKWVTSLQPALDQLLQQALRRTTGWITDQTSFGTELADLFEGRDTLLNGIAALADKKPPLKASELHQSITEMLIYYPNSNTSLDGQFSDNRQSRLMTRTALGELMGFLKSAATLEKP